MSLAQIELCKKSPLFGTEGLTSTSANYTANKAKELCDSLEKSIEDFTFLKRTYTLLESGNSHSVSATADKTIFEDIKVKLNKICKLHSLVAWLREGIKLKDNTLKEIQDTHVVDYVSEVLKETYPSAPVRKYINEDLMKQEYGFEKLQRRLELQAFAAGIGKYIHPNGTLSKARKEFNTLNNKEVVVGEGPSSMFISYSSTVNSDDIENSFMELQELQRTKQAELNGIEHEIDMRVLEANREASIQYKTESEEYSRITKDYDNKFNDWIREESKVISELKIVIPENLKGTYELVKGA